MMLSDPNSQAVIDNSRAQLLFGPFEHFFGTRCYQRIRGKKQCHFEDKVSWPSALIDLQSDIGSNRSQPVRQTF